MLIITGLNKRLEFKCLQWGGADVLALIGDVRRARMSQGFVLCFAHAPTDSCNVFLLQLRMQRTLCFLSHSTSIVAYVLVHFSSFSFTKGELISPYRLCQSRPPHPISSLTFQQASVRTEDRRRGKEHE